MFVLNEVLISDIIYLSLRAVGMYVGVSTSSTVGVPYCAGQSGRCSQFGEAAPRTAGRKHKIMTSVVHTYVTGEARCTYFFCASIYVASRRNREAYMYFFVLVASRLRNVHTRVGLESRTTGDVACVRRGGSFRTRTPLPVADMVALASKARAAACVFGVCLSSERKQRKKKLVIIFQEQVRGRGHGKR